MKEMRGDKSYMAYKIQKNGRSKSVLINNLFKCKFVKLLSQKTEIGRMD